MRLFTLVLAGSMACAFAPSVQLAPGAPHLAPSAKTEAVASVPAGAVLLGTVTVQANNHQRGQDCEAAALYEAKKIGATHAIVRPAAAGWGKGPKCTAEAYAVTPSPP